jgi:NAD-dependent SIR2 family protein deacetylase
MDFPEQLVDLLRTSSRVVALTGAEVSQESGLRTFRDTQTGLLAQYIYPRSKIALSTF